MTTTMRRTCSICVTDGGWHYDDNGHATRCANYLAAAGLTSEQTAAVEANEQAFEAAKRVIRDAAQTRERFSANDLRVELAAAQIPGSVVGSAFRAVAAEKDAPIERTTERVQSNEHTTRHEIYVWRSRCYRRTA